MPPRRRPPPADQRLLPASRIFGKTLPRHRPTQLAREPAVTDSHRNCLLPPPPRLLAVAGPGVTKLPCRLLAVALPVTRVSRDTPSQPRNFSLQPPECPEVVAVVGMNAPGNNQMIAPKIQKQLVNACAVETTNAILADLRDRWLTLLLDEARDCSVKEQMVVVIRYVNKHGEVIERFIAVVHVATTITACLKKAIDSLFAKYGLSMARLRGQGYDGASNMSGEFNGLKSLIMKENPCALYVHCFAHQLQLAVVAIAQANQYVCDFMWIVGSVVNTSTSSCKRADKLQQLEHDRKVKLLERGEISSGRGLNQETSLARPGDTRWGSHHSTLCRIEQMWPSIIEVLQNLIDDGDRSS
ncbi:zinc finger MYM-type protein 1-like [Zingiber officinale]|uniref:zinc finger MYM-type protein 1-like n=1 Tax=Zingiber officinale TaxID=94328 RepID=UPI001C4C655D|nr:zinc finger MYM-type protein 1-like [Zingiber officinale]